MHKGFKCLDVEGGRVYISCDIVFDEIVFPFTKLNPNAGVHLRFEILLLPFDSKPYNPPSHRSKSSVCPTAGVPVNPVSTNGLSLSDSAEKNSGQFGAGIILESAAQGAPTGCGAGTRSQEDSVSVVASDSRADNKADLARTPGLDAAVRVGFDDDTWAQESSTRADSEAYPPQSTFERDASADFHVSPLSVYARIFCG
jgi:hypothetical protein